MPKTSKSTKLKASPRRAPAPTVQLVPDPDPAVGLVLDLLLLGERIDAHNWEADEAGAKCMCDYYSALRRRLHAERPLTLAGTCAKIRFMRTELKRLGREAVAHNLDEALVNLLPANVAEAAA